MFGMGHGYGFSLSSSDGGRQEAHEAVPQVRRMVSDGKRSMFYMWREGILGAESTQGKEGAESIKPDDRIAGRNAKSMPNLRDVESRIRQELLRKVRCEALAYSTEVSFFHGHQRSCTHKFTRDASNGLREESSDSTMLAYQNQE